ncbi:hypothetical protein EOS_41575 [Caballeronia mineralivorans PML1(12)]|uniref:Uncharacterized protein n=1 Tax=Caballeronia mineralivorans PML1(12) TaxID=908627 RepID=A0A0J1CIQ4_9BURK|nr:hypothetical protein [Caballeronia mineralivorans]KLU20356.1 hypothetical protein EOS_41575 [Caballeronia mineralivorans PML1(12)]
MADFTTALVAFVGVLAGGYVNNFLAEDFRRFRDSQALAGSFAGELESHASGNHAKYLPERHEMMQVWADWLETIEMAAVAEKAPRSAA